MKIKTVIAILLFSMFLSIPHIGKAQVQDNLYESYITLLSPYIVEELLKQNIEDNSFAIEDTEIVSIERPDATNEYYPTLNVHTYTGPHNPPQGIATIKFKVSPYGVEIVNFKHKIVKK